jgi:hypothetical protein
MSHIAVVYDAREDRDKRLAQLGLTVEDLHAPIRYAYLARLGCNSNDPPGLAGILFWGRIVRGLREHLAAKGWRKNLEGRLAATVDEGSAVSIVVSTGDDETGDATGSPKSKFTKGPATRDAVTANGQVELFPTEFSEESIPNTWVLLVRVAHEVDAERAIRRTVINAELSRPSEMDDEGRIGGWFERIVLPPIIDEDDSGAQDRDVSDIGPDFDVDVQRRMG